MADGIAIVDGVMSAETLLHVRGTAGMTVYPLAQAEKGLSNTIFAVTARQEDRVVGIGRIIGDGGYFYDVVDIAVLPDCQGQGVGKLIMGRLVEWLKANLPEVAFVSLQADKGARHLYEKFGFVDRGSDQPGMVWKRDKA